MRKILVLMLALSIALAFCSCGSESSDEPTAYTPTDIQVEDADGVNVYSVIYDIPTDDNDAWKEQWSGYGSSDVCCQTAINGIKECKARDDWKDGSIVFGYAGEPLLKNMLYSYGKDGNFAEIGFYQLGIYNSAYALQDELD